MTDKVLTKVSLADLTARDMLWLIKAHQGCYTGDEPKHVLERMAQGTDLVYRLPDGILVATIVQHPAGKEFYVKGLAGEGVVKQAKQIVAALKEEAKGCRWLGGIGDTRKGLEFLYRRISGMTPWGVYYLMELDDVSGSV